jgi:hypothetical protein
MVDKLYRPSPERSHPVRLVRPPQCPNDLLINRLPRQWRDRIPNLPDYCRTSADKDEVYVKSISQFSL